MRQGHDMDFLLLQIEPEELQKAISSLADNLKGL